MHILNGLIRLMKIHEVPPRVKKTNVPKFMDLIVGFLRPSNMLKETTRIK